MEYNISQKINQENGRSTFTIEGDSEFYTSVSEIIKAFKDTLLNIPRILSNQRFPKRRHSKAPIPTTDSSFTIKANSGIAGSVIKANPDIMDKIVMIKDVNGNVLGLKFKL